MPDIAASQPVAIDNASSPPDQVYLKMPTPVSNPIQGGTVVVITGSNGANLNNGLN